MLDSFIIERIRREREQARERAYQPLRIERRPPPPPDRGPEVTKDDDERGSVIIDFRV